MWKFIVIVALLTCALLWFSMTVAARKRKRAIEEMLRRARRDVEMASGAEESRAARVKLARVQLDFAEHPRQACVVLEEVDGEEPYRWSDGERPTKIMLAEAYCGAGQKDRAMGILRQFLDALPQYASTSGDDRVGRLEMHRFEAERSLGRLRNNAQVTEEAS